MAAPSSGKTGAMHLRTGLTMIVCAMTVIGKKAIGKGEMATVDGERQNVVLLRVSVRPEGEMIC